jgi:hypothetical protein
MVPSTMVRRGPKGIPAETHNRIVEMAKGSVPAAEAIRETGVSQTKVYEIYRNPRRKEAPEETPPIPAPDPRPLPEPAKEGKGRREEERG